MFRFALALALAAAVGLARASSADPSLDHLDGTQRELEAEALGQATDDETEEEVQTRRRKGVVRTCRRLTLQIEHYQRIVELAQSREDELWEDEMQQHVDRLVIRRAAHCPEYPVDDKTWERFKAFLLVAGEIAIRYFTFGLF